MLQEAAKQWRCWGLSSAWTAYWCAGLSDRHSSIAKYMRENLAHIKHYFDLWHLKKS
jgi:hypothetical protein